MTFLVDISAETREAGISRAIARHDSAMIFDWLLTAFSFQGVSDQVARSYMRQNGRASWSVIEASLQAAPSCPRLGSYWHYEGCCYDKGSFTCSEAEHIDGCPVPRPKLRNGRLNQTAYSFFLFVRDIAKLDLVGWIDDQLTAEPSSDCPQTALQERLIGPLRNVYGVSDKILTMTLSALLLSAPDRPRWFEAGASMIAIDTLVHNFLHRTGVLHQTGATHPYGVGCYSPGGDWHIRPTPAFRRLGPFPSRPRRKEELPPSSSRVRRRLPGRCRGWR
jgi:hypothetical protein